LEEEDTTLHLGTDSIDAPMGSLCILKPAWYKESPNSDLTQMMSACGYIIAPNQEVIAHVRKMDKERAEAVL